jgi:adenine deaminase
VPSPPIPDGLITLRDDPVELTRRNEVGFNRAPAELVVSGGRVLGPTGELLELDVAIVGSRIAAVATDLVVPGARRIDASGKVVVPGYIDSHTHALGPYSAGAYVGEALKRGTTYVTTDDAHAYGLLTADGYREMVALSDVVPMVLRWSLRPEPSPRRLSRADAVRLVARLPQVAQVGELATHPELRELDGDLAQMLAGARNAGALIEGHNPGASPRTLGVSAAAGVTADHEAITATEVIARLRVGLWAFLRHNGLRPDVPTIVPELLASGVSLERIGLTADGPTPTWISRHGMVENAIRAAITAGMDPSEAYAIATWRPAGYIGLGAHLGAVAPGRLACLNVLGDAHEPMPELVVSLGREVARNGELLVLIPEVPWERLSPTPWSSRHERIALDAYEVRPDDPEVTLESQALVRSGPGVGSPAICLVFDPQTDRLTRGRMYGLPLGLRALASTLTPERLLVAVGNSPAAMKQCVDAIFDAGGGIAYADDGAVHTLPLPVGGAITSAPFSDISAFYCRLDDYVASLGHAFAQPVTTLLFIADDGLPGARFLADGLTDVRGGTLLAPSVAAPWEAGQVVRA